MRIIFSLFLLYSFASFGQTVLFLGDSLTEGYGVDPDKAYPTLLEKKFHDSGRKNIKIINGGISGSTSASAISRLKWFKKSAPTIMVLVLGANDGLRGLKIEQTKKNLSETIVEGQKLGMRVILGGMKLPFNYGQDYRVAFEKMYEGLAKEHKLVLIPFILEGVAGKKEYNLPDGMHPNEKGHEVVADFMFKKLGSLL